MTSAPREASPARALFKIEERASIFHVTLDGVFFGDYRTRAWAEEGAREKARAIVASGGSVQTVQISRTGAILSDISSGPG